MRTCAFDGCRISRPHSFPSDFHMAWQWLRMTAGPIAIYICNQSFFSIVLLTSCSAPRALASGIAVAGTTTVLHHNIHLASGESRGEHTSTSKEPFSIGALHSLNNYFLPHIHPPVPPLSPLPTFLHFSKLLCGWS